MVKTIERKHKYQKRMKQEIILRNRYEDKLKSAKEEAILTSKTKDEFLANISHEIRTPLNAIIGYSEKILLENPDTPFTKNINTILTESEHLLLLLNDLLDNAKIEADKLDLECIPFDLYKLLHTTAETFKEAADKKKLNFNIEISKDTPQFIIADPFRFRQILVNLLSNAIKFTEKGFITLKTATNSIFKNNAEVSFQVIDTGIGISKDKQDDIFKEFSQADGSTTRKYGGTGLGTTISKKLVNLMNGEMGVESELGKGSTFWFTLLLNTNVSETDLIEISRKNAHSPTANANKFTGTVLVAEDYEINQDLIKSQLEYLGLNVLISKNGKIALEDCKKIFFDLIFMDLQMPEMGGIEAARRIRIDYPHYEKVPIIALTANADKDIRKICKAVGMNSVLNKPTHIDELAGTLLKWLPKANKKGTIKLPSSILKDFNSKSYNEILQQQNEASNYNWKILKNLNITAESEKAPAINLAEALQLFGNNKVILNMTLKNFATSVEEQILPSLIQAVTDKDQQQIKHLAHKLKGGAASITAKELSTAAGMLEANADNNELKNTLIMLDEIQILFKKVKKFIENNC